MMKQLKTRLIISMLAAGFSISTLAAEIEEIHFLVPGGAGGGWDMTARGTGDVLFKSKLIDNVSFQNMSGGGGGKAIAHLIETADRQQDTLMVNSSPIVVRSLSGVFPHSFRDMTPVASIVSDYSAIVVRADSKYKTWKDIVADFQANPRKIKIAGGSARGSMDHLVVAEAFKGENFDPRTVRYIAYDAGGKAMAALLSGETQLLSTGLGEVLEMSKAGQIRIVAVTAPERIPSAPDIPTLTEYGNPTVFANWRGFFAAPGISKEKVAEWDRVLEKMYQTPEWKTLRDRNGWIDNYKPAPEFNAFLEAQEKQMGTLMRELGFIQ
ncbi:Bug family tripartite tricarboxylate transporter substrate binding protein [Vibrio sp. MEBiC08052]|uniref:tripartite tricarboxylate transporter substrate binding protein n=1 Tax=Vibrio sp. MEBiC08052 TaxID=1761910 RepID=UPI000740D404